MAYVMQISDTNYLRYPAPKVGDIFIVTSVTGGLPDAPEYLRDYGKRIALDPVPACAHCPLCTREAHTKEPLC